MGGGADIEEKNTCRIGVAKIRGHLHYFQQAFFYHFYHLGWVIKITFLEGGFAKLCVTASIHTKPHTR